MEGKIMVVMDMVHRKVKIPCMLLAQLMGHPPMATGIMSNQLELNYSRLCCLVGVWRYFLKKKKKLKRSIFGYDLN